jgi:hypothetical protein
MILGHSVLVHESFESCMLLGGVFYVAHGAVLNVECIRNWKLAAWIDLRGRHWNVSLMQLTSSSEVHVFPGDFTRNRQPVVLSLLSQKWMLFHVGGWHPYCVLKWHWTAGRDCNYASPNTHWTCSVVQHRYWARRMSPAGACTLASCEKKTFRVFLSDDINQIYVWQLVSKI